MMNIFSKLGLMKNQWKIFKILIYSLIFILFIFALYTHQIKINIVINKPTELYHERKSINQTNPPLPTVLNGLNSCPKTFRTRQPLFPWPPRPICDLECAISETKIRLPTIPWFAAKYRQFSNYNDIRYPEKWFNLNNYFKGISHRLKELNLLPPTKRKFVLDIGTGFGYLPFFASHLNHCVIAIDAHYKHPNYTRYFQPITNILGVDVRQHEITAMRPFPIDLFDGIKFDIVVVYEGSFHCTPRMWLLEEWMFFLSDIARHHTTENTYAHIYVDFCKNPNGQEIYTLWSNKTMEILRHKGVEFIKDSRGFRTMKIKKLASFRSDLFNRMPPNRLINTMPPNRLTNRMPPNRLINTMPPNRLINRIPPNRLINTMPPNRLINKILPNPLIPRN